MIKKTIFILLFLQIFQGCKDVDKETLSPNSKDFYHEGSCIFWTYYQSYCPITVYVDSELVGDIQYASSSSNPECYSPDGITVTKQPGTYYFSAFGTGGSWSGHITINSSCTKMQLTSK